MGAAGKNTAGGFRVLAVDYGASSGRGIIGDYDGSTLTTKEIHRFDNSPVTMLGRLTWDLPSLYGNLLTAITKSTVEGGVASVGIDTWGVDYGYIDKNKHVLANPVNYRDRRTENIREEFFRVIPWDELYARTGIQNLSFNTIYQLYCDVKNDGHILGAASRIMFMPDLLNFLLTGECATEYTIASTGAILDAESRNVAADLLLRIGFDPALLPPVVSPAHALGALSADVRELTGAGKGCRVVNTASHDTASAVLAVPTDTDGFVYISCGTWSLFGTETRTPIITELSRKYSFTNEGGTEGKVRFLKNIAGLWLEQESRRQWAREGVKYTYDELSDAAGAAEPCRYLIDPDDDIFTPPGDMPRRIAAYCRERQEGEPQTPGEIVRAIFDSLALRYRWCMEKIAELTGVRVREIHVVGGGVKETLLLRLAADACGVPVIAGPAEATAAGNICAQLIAAGELSGDGEARELIRRSNKLEVFEPQGDRAMWDDAYGRFLKLISAD